MKLHFMTKIKNSGFANELHKILCSPFFVYVMVFITVFMAVLEFVVPAFFLLACLISLVLITQKDIKPIIPLILDAILSIPEHLSFGGLKQFEKVVTIISLCILFVSIVWFFVSTFAVEKKKFVLGKLFWGLVAVAVVGAGLSGLLCAEYEHIYSVRFLGIVSAITLIYIVLINGTDESVKEYTMHAFVGFGIGACLLIINYYANVDDVVLAFHNKSLRVGFAITNIIAAAIGVCIPASIYLATKKCPQIFLPLAVIMYVAILFTFSRAGILVTTVVLPIALIYGFLVSKKKLHYGLTFGGCVAVILVLVLVLKDKLPIWFEHTKELGFSDNGRIELWKYGWEDFKRNKIFGAGFYGEDGADLVGPLKKYHSTIVQILACSGIVGVIGFGFHYYQRYKLMFKKLSVYKVFWLFALAVYEGCALIDIGQIMFFSQIMLALLFATCEKETEETLEPAFASIFKGGKKVKTQNLSSSENAEMDKMNSMADTQNKTKELFSAEKDSTLDATDTGSKTKAETSQEVEQIVKQIETINAEPVLVAPEVQENQPNATGSVFSELNSDNKNIQTQELSDKELTKKHKFYRYFLKRFFDITLSLIAMIILSPIYLVVSILVRMKLGKPVIFKQLRVGKNGEVIRFIKFRSMSDKVDKDGNLLPDAQRLTKLGKILRKTSIDELPQLALVFIGKMSLIGPRPRDIKECVFLNKTQSQRHLVRPGITGWAQCHGRNNLTLEQVCNYDRYYVENCSLWLDIKTIFLTIKTVLKKEGINGQIQQSNNFSEYHGDYLLRIGKITEEEYARTLAKAKELERKVMEKN